MNGPQEMNESRQKLALCIVAETLHCDFPIFWLKADLSTKTLSL